MIIHFSNTELNHLTFQLQERWERSAAYIEERDQVWDIEMAKVLARQDRMWNGEIYTLEEIVPAAGERITLRVSTSEYRDFIFRNVKGESYIASRFGQDYLFRGMALDCLPVTQDGKFVFGIRADWAGNGTHPVGMIGGTMNKDEMEIHTFEDVRQFMGKEIAEETDLPCLIEDLKFYGLLYQEGFFTFMFTFRLPLHSGEIGAFHRDGEFSRLVAWTRQEVLITHLPATRGFRRWQARVDQVEASLFG